ncbi:glucosamine-6-phosphate deaminase [Fictibacillus sp. Mic-4]|uniref:glucosamine-6-phosphate deaminase n=1 Tax=Fictibacillus sp. Mic-4 TaxID=3132826 RepID=UPI003CEF3F32
MKVIEVKNYDEMSKAGAKLIIAKIRSAEHVTLGLATGSTPIGTYKELILDFKENGTSYQHVSTINLDEYVGLSRSDATSYNQYMYEQLFKHIDIPLKQTHLPNGAANNLEEECRRYDEIIEQMGGIDLQLLGIGRNGHIGFNEPGTPFSTKTHIVDLTQSTLQANAQYFSDPSKQPKKAITMGIASILKSKEIVLLASGESKARAIYNLLYGEVTEEMPASSLKNHPNVTVIADSEALRLVKQEEMGQKI